ncbi:MAG: hypothetical protein JST12_07830 [Armatimonadetes bacterium]|nr:hypothetical protein [Armatimonadota bacterium]MBS1701554.1 hypothetical protein [Armatimonadota bacterium]MBS1725704.1 hypothetical protein [Armatimonadota bacterium]
MVTSIAMAIALAPVGQTLKLPVYNADQKNPAVTDYAVTALPLGFTDVKIGSGLIKSEDGSISMSVLRSRTDMPSLLRNSKAHKGDGFTTIRMTNWIGYRNSRKNGEDYKLDFHHYRISLALDYTDKSKLTNLRNALHTLIDNLNLTPH